MFCIKKETQNKITIERSKFLGFVFYCDNLKVKEEILKKIKKEYFSATHICFAYRMYFDNQFQEYFSDDKEPCGTAGGEILSVLKKYQLINILCVVVRYFGGVKLGVQGLSKAYRDCCSSLIENNLREVKLKKQYFISCSYNQFDYIKKIVKNFAPIEVSFGKETTFKTFLDLEEYSFLNKNVCELKEIKGVQKVF